MAGLLFALAMAASFYSCSKSDEAAAPGLLELAGADASAVAMAHPVEILRSAGAEIVDGRVTLPSSLTDSPLHSSDLHVLVSLCGAEGLSLDNALVVTYVNPRMGAMVFAVEDAGRLAASLGQAGWTGTECPAGEAYVHEAARNVSLLCSEGRLWVLRRDTPERLAATVGALKGRAATPLPEWLRDELSAPGCAVRLAVAPDTTRVLVAGVSLDGTAMSVDARMASASDGARLPMADIAKARMIGPAAALINPDDILSLGIALPEGTDIGALVRRLDYNLYTAPSMAAAIDMLDGRIVVSAGLVDRSSANVMDFSNYRVAIGLGTLPDRAPELLGFVRSHISSTGLPVTVSADGDMVVVETRTARRGDPGDASRAMGVLTADIPADMGLLQLVGIPCGLDAGIVLTNESLKAEIAFTGTDQGFIAALLSILNVFA